MSTSHIILPATPIHEPLAKPPAPILQIPLPAPSINDDTQPDFEWSSSIDTMLANWCDQSKCFNWMHTESYARYSKRATAMSISTNIVISLSGIANLVLGTTIDNMSISLIFGCISIGVGIVNMIQEKFAFASLATDYKRSAQQWDLIKRKIEEQLSIPYNGRKDCGTFLKYIKQDINSISDTNSLIPQDIRLACNTKFGAIAKFDVPDICGQMEHTAVYVADVKSGTEAK